MKYKGGFEPKIAKQLRRLKAKFQYEGWTFPYFIAKNYTPDFTITTNSGKLIHVEVKGWLRPEDRTKLIAVKLANPDLDLRMIFGADNKLNKNARMRYSDWAKKYKLPYAIGSVPKEWLDE